jgi:hypothetical protein
MFLFSKLVLENLYGQQNLEDVYMEMRPNIFPHGFEQACVHSNISCSLLIGTAINVSSAGYPRIPTLGNEKQHGNY